MRVIDIPEPVKVTVIRMTGEPLTESWGLPKIVLLAIDTYGTQADESGRMARRITVSQYKQAAKIVDVFQNLDGAKSVQLEDADWELVKAAAVDTSPWTMQIGRQILPILKAIEDAQEVETPAKK